MKKQSTFAKLSGLVSHETWASLIGMIYLGLIVNLLLVVACLPLVVLLVATDPMYSWPLLAVARRSRPRAWSARSAPSASSPTAAADPSARSRRGSETHAGAPSCWARR
jgi:hypothetical protein